MVPLRVMADHMGATLTVEGNRVTMIKGQTRVVFTLGSNEVIVNGERRTLSAQARVTQGRAFVPARCFAEFLGYTLFYNRNMNIMSFSSPNHVRLVQESEHQIRVQEEARREAERQAEFRRTELARIDREHVERLREQGGELMPPHAIFTLIHGQSIPYWEWRYLDRAYLAGGQFTSSELLRQVFELEALAESLQPKVVTVGDFVFFPGHVTGALLVIADAKMERVNLALGLSHLLPMPGVGKNMFPAAEFSGYHSFPPMTDEFAVNPKN